MFVKMLPSEARLNVGGIGTISFGHMIHPLSTESDDLCVAVAVDFLDGPYRFHVGGAVVFLPNAPGSLCVPPNSWFKINNVGFKVFVTDRLGKFFADGQLRIIIDAPAEVEINQC